MLYTQNLYNVVNQCCVQLLSRVQLFLAPGTVAQQAPLSMNFQARILEWVPFPTAGDHPKPGIESASLVSPALAGRFFTNSTAWEAQTRVVIVQSPSCV